jgi:hypothetical protein
MVRATRLIISTAKASFNVIEVDPLTLVLVCESHLHTSCGYYSRYPDSVIALIVPSPIQLNEWYSLYNL